VLEPSTLDHIPKNTFFDMPSLFDKLLAQKKNTAAFPISEYWLDIGQRTDFERALSEYGDDFE
jgi:NDP-sugar pyrophosphorylase family protein